MKSERLRKGLGVLLSILALLINYSPQVQAVRCLPDTIVLRAGQSHELDLGLSMEVQVSDGSLSVLSSTDESLQHAKNVRLQAEEEGTSTINLKWMGLPMKSLSVEVAPERILIPGGHSIGVALETNGVLVVGTSEISGAQGGSPAYAAGLRPGDLIQTVDNIPVESTSQLTSMINSSSGKQVEIRFLRKNQLQLANVTPVLDRLDGTYRLGIWVRDSTAGVGTLSFYDPQNQRYAALGHAITDVDTGTNLTVRQGRVLFSEVLDIIKGKKGQPGELRGSFLRDPKVFGNIIDNTDYGVTGETTESIANALYPNGLPVGSQANVHTGAATILTTLDGEGIKEYDIEITRVNHQTEPGQKSMTLLVTDPELLEKTGGIVQGMSGSPIIQDGHIIGAVTHVYVNDPTQGYGLFIEWMLGQTDA
ncbi:MAG: SpoIVB peptidase [Oscillospiraceae bacterium]|jgi:stage IV sporulation protein B|nr:SpoIVB peptidase [Oscillospiraceae bacterium]